MIYSNLRQNPVVMNIFLSFSIFLLLLSCNEGLQQGSSNLRFVFIGDVHYQIPDYSVAEYFVPHAAKAFSQLNPKPEFVIQTGDFFHASENADLDAEVSFAFSHFSENIGLPFFIAKGNHDIRKPYEKYGLPIFSQELGREITQPYYSFDKTNCHFIILDCTDKDLSDQLVWLENDLNKATVDDNVKHIFAAGHYPLWPVARAGFTRPEYAEPVAKILAKYKVDAYFCGHTHNHSTTVRLIEGSPLTQIMGAAVVDEGVIANLAPSVIRAQDDPVKTSSIKLVPLEEAHNILIPKEELRYSWGYQEGSNSCYFVITVTDENVQVDYHVLDKGNLHSFKWEKPGEIINLKEPVPAAVKKITDTDFENIEQAWLYTAPYTEQKHVKIPFTINGVDAGILDLSNTINDFSPFWDKLEVPISKSAFAAIKNNNQIRFIVKGNSEFAFAHTLLLIKLKDGRYVKSDISANVFANFQLSRTANFAPSEKWIHLVEKGQDIEDVVTF